jgi:hypothetical protein
MKSLVLICGFCLGLAVFFQPAGIAEAGAKRQHTAHIKAHAKRYKAAKPEIHFRHSKGHLTRTARRGYHGKMTLNEIMYGPAGMPPAPHDFGPHFDYPSVPLNGGITSSPYLH